MIAILDLLPQILVHLIFLLIFGLGPLAFLMHWGTVKFTADTQARVGPNRAGKNGALQGLTDLIRRSLQRGVRGKLHVEALIWILFRDGVVSMTLFLIPFGIFRSVMSTELNLWVLVFSYLLIAVLRFVIHLHGTLRFSGLALTMRGQLFALTSLVPISFAFLSVGLVSGSFKLSNILSQQNSSLLDWQIWATPFQWISFLVMFTGGMILVQMKPFHAAHWKGLQTFSVESASSGSMGLLEIAQNSYLRVLWSVLLVSLFFGGSSGGEIHLNSPFFELAMLVIKCLPILILWSLIGEISPRVRYDRIIFLIWSLLVPMSIFSLIGSFFWVLVAQSLGGIH
jgi:NADH-quinone oxidoreductase subunit H